MQQHSVEVINLGIFNVIVFVHVHAFFAAGVKTMACAYSRLRNGSERLFCICPVWKSSPFVFPSTFQCWPYYCGKKVKRNCVFLDWVKGGIERMQLLSSAFGHWVLTKAATENREVNFANRLNPSSIPSLSPLPPFLWTAPSSHLAYFPLCTLYPRFIFSFINIF